MDLSEIRVTHHAWERYQIHHPSAGRGEVREAVRYGVEVDEGTARPLIGRGWSNPHSNKTYYRLAPDRRGIFAAVDRPEGGVVIVTYLRFQKMQEEFAKKHWPMTVPRRKVARRPRKAAVHPVRHPVTQISVSQGLQKKFGLRKAVREALREAPIVPGLKDVFEAHNGSETVRIQVFQEDGKWRAVVYNPDQEAVPRLELMATMMASIMIPIRRVRLDEHFTEWAGGKGKARRSLYDLRGSLGTTGPVRNGEGEDAEIELYQVVFYHIDGSIRREWHAGLVGSPDLDAPRETFHPDIPPFTLQVLGQALADWWSKHAA